MIATFHIFGDLTLQLPRKSSLIISIYIHNCMFLKKSCKILENSKFETKNRVLPLGWMSIKYAAVLDSKSRISEHVQNSSYCSFLTRDVNQLGSEDSSTRRRIQAAIHPIFFNTSTWFKNPFASELWVYWFLTISLKWQLIIFQDGSWDSNQTRKYLGPKSNPQKWMIFLQWSVDLT